MSQLIDGKKIAEKIKDNITQEIFKLGTRPNLAIILVEGRGDSDLYVSLKEREAKKVGIDTHLYKLASEVKESDLLEIINFLNNDNLVDGILVQLPLPKHLNTDKIIKAINPMKDVDGFHPENLERLKKGESLIIPPVFGAVFEMLKNINFDIENKEVCILSNSEIFRDNLALMLNNMKAKTKCFPAVNPETKNADVLITALGKPHSIKKEMVKKDAVIIDIGITKDKKSIKGDVDFNDVEDYCSYITPVPGGVGPLTIAMTFQNTLNSYKGRKLNSVVH